MVINLIIMIHLRDTNIDKKVAQLASKFEGSLCRFFFKYDFQFII